MLCGCGGMTTDEAKDYVKSALDAGYKAEFKEYAEITDSTEKEAKKEYETNLDNSMKEAGFDETGVSDELKANYRKLFEKMLKSANYKVGEVKEAGDDEFKVSVEVQPFTAFSTVSEELDNWVTDTYSNIEYVPSDEELNEAIMKKMVQYIKDGKLKEVTGHTFGTLLARYRLQEALKLLDDGRYKVYEVAEHTGFGEYKNFCQVFKKYLQVSPKRYMQERELKLSK